MDFDTFEKTIHAEPKLANSLLRAAHGIRHAQVETRSFDLDPVSTATGLGALAILFLVVKHIVYRIGLPWIKTAENFSELWRSQAEQWINEQYEQKGFDPDKTRAASEAMLQELLKTTDDETRGAWQRLIGLVPKDESKGDS